MCLWHFVCLHTCLVHDLTGNLSTSMPFTDYYKDSSDIHFFTHFFQFLPYFPLIAIILKKFITSHPNLSILWKVIMFLIILGIYWGIIWQFVIFFRIVVFHLVPFYMKLVTYIYYIYIANFTEKWPGRKTTKSWIKLPNCQIIPQ